MINICKKKTLNKMKTTLNNKGDVIIEDQNAVASSASDGQATVNKSNSGDSLSPQHHHTNQTTENLVKSQAKHYIIGMSSVYLHYYYFYTKLKKYHTANNSSALLTLETIQKCLKYFLFFLTNHTLTYYSLKLVT